MMMKSRRLSWAGHVASTGEMKISYKSLVKKSGNRRLRRRKEDNIKIYFT